MPPKLRRPASATKPAKKESPTKGRQAGNANDEGLKEAMAPWVTTKNFVNYTTVTKMSSFDKVRAPHYVKHMQRVSAVDKGFNFPKNRIRNCLLLINKDCHLKARDDVFPLFFIRLVLETRASLQKIRKHMFLEFLGIPIGIP